MITKIFDYGMNGEGVSKIDGKVVLIPSAILDEVVDIDITIEHSNYLEAKVNYIVEKNTNREIPPCPYFDVCGGCDLQHMSYNEQLVFKRILIKKTLKKITNINAIVSPTVLSDYQYKYRNKISVNIDAKNCGFFVEKSKNIIDIKDCLLANNEIRSIYSRFREWLNHHTDLRIHIRNIVIREIDDQILVGLVCRENINISSLYDELIKTNKNVGLYAILNKRRDSVVLSGKVKHIAGLKKIKVTNYGLTYFVDLMGFHQTNINIQDKLYSKVLEYIKPDSTVVNGFSGQGLLTAILSKKAKQVIGIEINESSHLSAEELKRINKIENMINILGDFNEVIKNQVLLADTLILDPSKKGCGESILSELHEFKDIIYISCNPIALAKDLKTLMNKYNIEEITPFDMFPNTKSVETLVKLKLKEN